MNRLGLVINMDKENVFNLARDIIDWLEKKGCQVFLNYKECQVLGREDLCYPRGEFCENVDCILVLGGDGTLLNTARILAPSGIPLFGVNFGQLGFLTEVEIADVVPSLEKLLAGQFTIEERMMLEAAVSRDGQIINKYICLNDVVITKGAFSRLIYLETFINGEYVETYPADGLIVSTPTGSTAYSLSAGGPLVEPNLELMLITPICPHTLYARPMVVSSEEEIKVHLISNQGEVMLTLDGQHGISIKQGDEIIVKKSTCKARLLKLRQRTFFKVVREKMKEGHNSDV